MGFRGASRRYALNCITVKMLLFREHRWVECLRIDLIEFFPLGVVVGFGVGVSDLLGLCHLCGSKFLICGRDGECRGIGGDADQAVRAAVRLLQERRREKKRARELLTAAREEMKQKSPMTEKARQRARGKSTLQSYFTSSRHAGSGAPLMLVPDSMDPNVPGAEPETESSKEDCTIAAMLQMRTRGGRCL